MALKYQYCTKPGQCMFKRTEKEALYSMFTGICGDFSNLPLYPWDVEQQ